MLVHLRFTTCLFAATAAFFLTTPAAHADGQAFSAYIENDSRNIGGPGSDREYTNGVRFSYIDVVDNVPVWSRPVIHLSALLGPGSAEGAKTNYGLALGQQIYTPNDVSSSSLIHNDRPFAAWLYAGFSAHIESEKRSVLIEVDFGVVGPEAEGEQVQNGFHRLIGRAPVDGWNNQLGTEPTLQIFYQQRRKVFSLQTASGSRYFDVVPYFGAGLGNVMVAAHDGGEVRLGFSLPDDFGPTRASSMDGDSFISPAHFTQEQKSVYLFTGARVVGVAHNIFLDGNTFRDSPRVTRIPLVLEYEYGLGALVDRWNFAWRYVTRTPEFYERRDLTNFASISLTREF